MNRPMPSPITATAAMTASTTTSAIQTVEGTSFKPPQLPLASVDTRSSSLSIMLGILMRLPALEFR